MAHETADASFRDGVRKNVELAQFLGVETRWIEREEIFRYAPWARLDDVVGAAYEPRSGYADPHGVTAGFAEGAKKYGALIRQNCPVIGLSINGRGLHRVKTSRDVIKSPIVVNASGAWVNKVAALSGHRFPAEAIREQDTVFDAVGGNGERIEIVILRCQATTFVRT